MDRQSLAGLIPLVAIVLALAEYLFDHTVPRWHSPSFWVALLATVALLVLVQVLRFRGGGVLGSGSSRPSSKPPDISARTMVGNRDVLRRPGDDH